ncbi:MAG: hypothetical protein AB1726_10725 [Planctomycetota bacterium]
MHDTTNRSSGGGRPSRLLIAGLVLGAGALGGPAAAQGSPPRLLVSTTDDVAASATHPFLSDASLTAVAGGGEVRPHLVEGHWLGAGGFVPTDIDAFARQPGYAPGRNESVCFSLLSNESGVQDGDVLALQASGGVGVLLAEDAIVAALGLAGVDIDVDALAFDDQGRLLFSLQNDLAGTYLGPLEDGDVLRYVTNGSVELVFEEPAIQTMFTAATGLTGAIGDVLGLEFFNGEIWVTTQGPSSHDGAVLACTFVPYIVADEAAVGLEGEEIDALSILAPGEEIPTLCIDRTAAAAGDTFHATMHGAPGSLHLVLLAGTAGYVDFRRFPGWGALMMSLSDPWLGTVLADPPATFVLLDANGTVELDYTLPTAAVWGLGLAGEEGWSFQMIDLRSLELAAPCRVKRV